MNNTLQWNEIIMKLAELLNQRKSLKWEIKKIKERLYLSAEVEEGY